jgi:uncharacterized protein YjbK
MTETEATLVVVSERPEEVLAEIERLTSVGPYKLGPSRMLKFEDRYFDTVDRALSKNKWALRLRNIGSETRIALKGPSLNKDWGAVERLEIELSWDSRSVSKIFDEIASQELGVTLPDNWQFSADPSKTLKSSGLQVIQHRNTIRRLKEVLIEKSGYVVAELALDSVVYLLAHGKVLHVEVEIETKDYGDSNATKTVLEFLTRLYGSELLPWPHSKLVTGEAMEILTQQARLGDRFQRALLARGDYRMIDGYIKDNR